MIELFWDDVDGGLLTTGSDGERLLIARKELTDNPTPAANSNAAFALLRVAAIHGRADLAGRADTILRPVSGEMGAQPHAFPRLLAAFDIGAAGMTEIVIAGGAARSRRRRPPPGIYPTASWSTGRAFDSPAWHGRTGDQAFVCRNYTCGLPTDNASTLAEQLSAQP